MVSLPMTSMGGVRVPTWLGIIILLSLLSPAIMESEVYQLCPGVNQSNTTEKLALKVGMLLDWKWNVTGNASASVGSVLSLNANGYNQFLSSPAAQAAVSQAAMINNNSEILPEHNVCLWFVFYQFNGQEVQVNIPIWFGQNRIRAVINAVLNENSFEKQSPVLGHYFPTVILKPNSKIPCFTHDDIDGVHDHADHASTTSSSYALLDLIPPYIDLLVASRMFTKHMGWEKIGIISDCDPPVSDNSSIFFTKYDQTDFVKMFKPFAQNEIRIYIFVGKLTTYLQLIRVAYTKGVTKKGYVYRKGMHKRGLLFCSPTDLYGSFHTPPQLWIQLK